MKHFYGAVLIAWLAVGQIINSSTDILGIASLLGALCLFIVKERYFDRVSASIFYLVFVFLLTQYNAGFILLYGIPLLDFLYFRKYPAAALTFSIAAFFCVQSGKPDDIFYMVSSGLFGYITGAKDKNEKNHISLIDEERRLRYNLEQTQNELILSKKEIEHLTEVRERNRIAHEIHDNIGHRIAGVIFQLEAALRIFHRDAEKAEGIIRLCSEKLTEALEMTRNTVYNIRAEKKTGIASIEKIVDDFKFCRISFEHSGDFSLVSASNTRILEANIMEALTNASKYSQADDIRIKLDVKKNNLRLYYRDNGVGCRDIHENIGLSGMRERVRNAGGTISVDGSRGFLIVCNLPVHQDDYAGGERL